MNRTHLTSIFALAVACGGSEPKPGWTECASAECAPGQYCEGGLFCLAGCVSDANCLEDSRCGEISDVTHVGTCQESAPPPVTEDPPAREATCDGYAGYAQSCGLPASEAEAIRQSCDQLDADTKRALVACAASETCGELLSCSGVQCFTDSHCAPAAPDCVLRRDVVDPFTDIPYSCR